MRDQDDMLATWAARQTVYSAEQDFVSRTTEAAWAPYPFGTFPDVLEWPSTLV
jgi:hypothetical protein